MHKSKLAGIIIDCQSDNLASCAGFWSAALGMAMKTLPPDEASTYIQLVDPAARMNVEVQTVTHPSRVHLDIEADDVEAEVRRLESLGAARVQQVKRWWVLQAPTGQRFCVVPVFSADFANTANEWP